MKLIIDVDEKLVCKGFEQSFTEEERDILIRAIGNGTPYEERPHGHWISANGTYYCSCCKHYAYERQKFDFCQDCGADMRGNTKRKGTPIEGNNESYNCENWIP